MKNFALSLFLTLSLAVFGEPYCELKDGLLKLGNSKIERAYKFNGGDLLTSYVLDKTSGIKWESKGSVPDFNIPGSEAASGAEFSKRSFRRGDVDFLEASVSFKKGELEVKRVLEIADNSQFVSSQVYLRGKARGLFAGRGGSKADMKNMERLEIASDGRKMPTLDRLSLKRGVWTVRAVEFFDVTDRNYTLVREFSDFPVRANSYRGNLLFAREADSNAGLIFVKHSPVSEVQLAYPGADFTAEGGSFGVIGLGAADADVSENDWTRVYGCSLGVFSGGDLEALSALRVFQKNARAGRAQSDEMVMMNTWGDRGQDKKVDEKFCISEIESGARLGITHFQIDDGWQTGRSANSAFKGGSFKNIWANPNYWKPNPAKYPSGLKSVVDAAKKAGVELCLWFNPSVQNDFEDWQKDAEAMIEMYRLYGVKVFKIDGVSVSSKTGEKRLRMMFDKVVSATNSEAIFNLDVTAGRRGGYFYLQEYGNIFLENRYTDWGNYFPFSTLRNVWMLSKYVPPEKIQVEFLNKWRNAGKYGGSVLAPSNYSFEYLFAVAMAGQPLAWFEATGLPEEAFALSGLIGEYKKISRQFHGGVILPIGDEPSGFSWTGFQSLVDGENGFVLIFRERNANAKKRINLYGGENCIFEFKPVFSGRGKAFNAVSDGFGGVEFCIDKENDFVMYSYKSKRVKN